MGISAAARAFRGASDHAPVAAAAAVALAPVPRNSRRPILLVLTSRAMMSLLVDVWIRVRSVPRQVPEGTLLGHREANLPVDQDVNDAGPAAAHGLAQDRPQLGGLLHAEPAGAVQLGELGEVGVEAGPGLLHRDVDADVVLLVLRLLDVPHGPVRHVVEDH